MEDSLPKEVLEALKGRKLEDIAIGVVYRNWRGEVGERRIFPLNIFYGSTEYHTEEQWLLRVFDVDKRDYRTYALRDIQSWTSIP